MKTKDSPLLAKVRVIVLIIVLYMLDLATFWRFMKVNNCVSLRCYRWVEILSERPMIMLGVKHVRKAYSRTLIATCKLIIIIYSIKILLDII